LTFFVKFVVKKILILTGSTLPHQPLKRVNAVQPLHNFWLFIISAVEIVLEFKPAIRDELFELPLRW